MKYRFAVAALSAAVVCAPLTVNAGLVDCTGEPASDTCDLPDNVVITTSEDIASLTLDNMVGAWILAADETGAGIGQVLGQLPFAIIAGAPSQSLRIMSNGNVVVGPGGGDASLKIRRSNGTAKVFVEDDQVPGNPGVPQVMFELRRPGAARFDIVDESSGVNWTFQNRNGTFDISQVGTGVQEFKLDGSGNLTITGALQQSSDVNAKEDFQSIDGSSLLEDLGRLPIAKWRYKDDSTGSQHIGPTAQDFHAVFNVGTNDKTIAPLDVASVAVAGVKELHVMVAEQEASLAAKDAELAAMSERVAELEDSMKRLMLMLQHASR